MQPGGDLGAVADKCMVRVKGLLVGAYALALLPSTTQLLVWTTVEPNAVAAPGWRQCTTVWRAAYYEGRVGHKSNRLTENKMLQISRDEVASWRFYGLTITGYQLWHLCMTFWAPLTVIVMCYRCAFHGPIVHACH